MTATWQKTPTKSRPTTGRCEFELEIRQPVTLFTSTAHWRSISLNTAIASPFSTMCQPTHPVPKLPQSSECPYVWSVHHTERAYKVWRSTNSTTVSPGSTTWPTWCVVTTRSGPAALNKLNGLCIAGDSMFPAAFSLRRREPAKACGPVRQPLTHGRKSSPCQDNTIATAQDHRIEAGVPARWCGRDGPGQEWGQFIGGGCHWPEKPFWFGVSLLLSG